MAVRKAFKFEIKSTGEDGTFIGLASTYGNTDRQNDIVERGAFTKTLKESGAEVPILWQHKQDMPIGVGTLVDTPEGLQITGKLTLAVQAAKEAHALLQDGAIRGLSIGYDVIKRKFDNGIRRLQELKLYEVSVVTFPANEVATVSAVKALELPSDVRPYQVAYVVAESRKSASYQERCDAIWRVIHQAFPLVYCYASAIYEDYCLVQAGDRLFRVPITSWGEDGDTPVLGDPVEGTMEFVTLGTSATTPAPPPGTKAGARHSKADLDMIQTVHDHAVDLGAVCAVGEQAVSGTPATKGAAAAPIDPDEVQSLRIGMNAALRPIGT